MKFVVEKQINAKRQHVFDVIANYENLDKILPKYFPSIRVRSVRENIAIVEVHMKLGQKELVMTTKHVTKYPETHDVFVLGGDAKGSHFAEIYEKTSNGTNLTISVDYKQNGLAKLFGKSNIPIEYGTIIDELAKISEA